MRAQRMSPKMPASRTPIASTTATQPAGIASIAARVETGEAQAAGVARSSRAGTKRSVKAGPAMRACSGRSGSVPRIQTLRRPFFSKIVVIVAVVTPSSVSRALSSKGIVSSLAARPPWSADAEADDMQHDQREVEGGDEEGDAQRDEFPPQHARHCGVGWAIDMTSCDASAVRMKSACSIAA